MKKAIAACVATFIFVQLSVMAYLAVCYPDTSSSDSVVMPQAKLISNSFESQTGTSALSAYDSLSSYSEQTLVYESLISNAGVIATNIGESESDVVSKINSLNIDDWEIANVPDDMTATESQPIYTDEDDGSALSSFMYKKKECVVFSSPDKNVTLYVPSGSSETIDQLSQPQ